MINPVNKTSKGITESLAPMTLNFSGLFSKTLTNPVMGFPSPILAKAISGMANPPTKSPYPLMVSDIATAFRPPKIA